MGVVERTLISINYYGVNWADLEFVYRKHTVILIEALAVLRNQTYKQCPGQHKCYCLK